MIVFHADLDNTLIYSYRHEIGADKRCVEHYEGREVSYATEKTLTMLSALNRKVLLVPTTTRTVEQYRRIQLGDIIPRYALTCNGGLLLEEGEPDPAWYAESVRLAEPAQAALQQGMRELEKDPNRSFAVRFIESLFLFTKSQCPERTLELLRTTIDSARVDIHAHGDKIYVIPKALSKGEAVRRFRKKTGAAQVVAAGDSVFDLPMLAEAETAFAPEELRTKIPPDIWSKVTCLPPLFSETCLEQILKIT